MNDKQTKPKAEKTAKTREDRLKAALKANMAKRKAQARARAAGPDKEMKE
jgi:hypothetical protein